YYKKQKTRELLLVLQAVPIVCLKSFCPMTNSVGLLFAYTIPEEPHQTRNSRHGLALAPMYRDFQTKVQTVRRVAAKVSYSSSLLQKLVRHTTYMFQDK